MKRKIGIITIQGDNYGAVLQAAALNHFLNARGFFAENLDYNDTNRVKSGLSLKQKIINGLWTKVAVKMLIGNRKAKKFERFRRDTIRFSDSHWRSKEALAADCPQYDIYMSGSDQIWNPDVMLKDQNYLLAFAPDDAKKIAYASSFGKSKLPEDKKAVYKQLLTRFDSISVREKSGVDIVADLLGHGCAQVVDPTLLLTAEEWAALTDYRPTGEPYILCYYMPGDKTVCAAIKKIAETLSKKTGYPVVNLGLKEYYKFVPGMDCRVDAGPADFVHLFLGAEYVVTNSFHGTAFSTNFGKTVYVPINRELDTSKARHIRMVDYLDAIGLHAAVIHVGADGVTTDVSTTKFDYGPVHLNIQNMRNASVEYLLNSIK